MTAQIHSIERGFEHTTEPETIRVVEGWVGNWRISLRRRDTSLEDRAAYHRNTNETGD